MTEQAIDTETLEDELLDFAFGNLSHGDLSEYADRVVLDLLTLLHDCALRAIRDDNRVTPTQAREFIESLAAHYSLRSRVVAPLYLYTMSAVQQMEQHASLLRNLS